MVEFNTRHARQRLSIHIPKLRQAAFIRSETFEQLQEFIESIKIQSTPASDRWVYKLKDMGGRGLRLYDELCEMLEWRAKTPDGRIMVLASYNAKYREAQQFYDKYDKSDKSGKSDKSDKSGKSK